MSADWVRAQWTAQNESGREDGRQDKVRRVVALSKLMAQSTAAVSLQRRRTGRATGDR